MAINKSSAEFDNLLVKNKDTFAKNRGSKSPYAPIDAPVGPYYARLVSAIRDVEQVDQKDQNGKKTGFKVPTLRVRHLWSFVASSDPQCPPSERERWAGQQVYQNYRLPEKDDDAWKRYYGDLEQIGIDTNGLVLTEAEIQDQDNQYTIGMVCDYLSQEKPFGKLNLTQGDPTKGDAKFVNYRGSVKQEELEQLLQHPIGDVVESVQEEQSYEAVDPGTVPFDTNQEEPQEEGDGDFEWVEEYGLFKGLGQYDGKWFDKEGNEVEDPTKPKAPPKPTMKKPTPPAAPAKPVATSKPTPPPIGGTRPLKPGARK